MKAVGRSSGTVEADQELEDIVFHSTPPKRRKKDDPYFTDKNIINYDLMIPMLPTLKHVRGAKEKVQIYTFKEISDTCEEIFQKNHSVFQSRSQVDRLCHYWGAKVMEQIFLVMKGWPKSKLSLILEAQEPQFKLYDDLKTIKEIIRNYTEKYSQGLMTEKELHEHVTLYLDACPDENSRQKLLLIIENMLDEGEVKKAQDRLRKRNERKRAIEKRGLSLV